MNILVCMHIVIVMASVRHFDSQNVSLISGKLVAQNLPYTHQKLLRNANQFVAVRNMRKSIMLRKGFFISSVCGGAEPATLLTRCFIKELINKSASRLNHQVIVRVIISSAISAQQNTSYSKRSNFVLCTQSPNIVSCFIIINFRHSMSQYVRK